MPVIKSSDIFEGEEALRSWLARARNIQKTVATNDIATLTDISVPLSRREMAMAVRYSLYMLELRAPGEGVEVRVAPFAAVKILEGPASDPHNLTPPDVIELEPNVWLRLATGITQWADEKNAGHISAVGIRDDLSEFLPLSLS